MDDPKAQTLEALEEFIAAQRSLLSRTQEDIERLRALKGEVVRDPQDFFENLGEKLDSPSFRLSEHGEAYSLAFGKKIQWGAFSGHDPTPLTTLNPPPHPRSPLKTQSAPLSSMQLFVKSAKRSIIDPVFVRFPPPLSLTDDEELSGIGSLPVDPEEQRRRREHEKIRELKRMVKLGGKGRGGGLSLPKSVYMREGVEDESVEVDMSMDCARGAGQG
ncbi:hypothetical protein NMY22_g14931 [Coprinellus aureogranulatus]|nr:hypothetical protein NMY22_g14931 [Coprinellus aureogranulatus]